MIARKAIYLVALATAGLGGSATLAQAPYLEAEPDTRPADVRPEAALPPPDFTDRGVRDAGNDRDPRDARQPQDARPAFSEAELDQLLAPIALYPDPLLTQVLMASTYPIEIVQADRWVKANPNLTGEPLAAELERQPWDPSVKSLVNSPQLLEMMSDKLDWTARLGDAFLGQEAQVMDTVQKLRAKAADAGAFKDAPEQKIVVVEKQLPTRVIEIQPADPEVIYVPAYDPTVVYGSWWYPSYPPYYCYPRGYPVYSTGIWFGLSFNCGVPWGYAWGHSDWHHHHTNIDVHRHSSLNHSIDRQHFQTSLDRRDARFNAGDNVWVHDSNHRRGLSYRDPNVAARFGGMSRDQVHLQRERARSSGGSSVNVANDIRDSRDITRSRVRGEDPRDISTSHVGGNDPRDISRSRVRGEDPRDISTSHVRGNDPRDISQSRVRGEDPRDIGRSRNIRGGTSAAPGPQPADQNASPPPAETPRVREIPLRGSRGASPSGSSGSSAFRSADRSDSPAAVNVDTAPPRGGSMRGIESRRTIVRDAPAPRMSAAPASSAPRQIRSADGGGGSSRGASAPSGGGNRGTGVGQRGGGADHGRGGTSGSQRR